MILPKYCWVQLRISSFSDKTVNATDTNKTESTAEEEQPESSQPDTPTIETSESTAENKTTSSEGDFRVLCFGVNLLCFLRGENEEWRQV